jgi:serine/threonine protein phosphatase PrpC
MEPDEMPETADYTPMSLGTTAPPRPSEPVRADLAGRSHPGKVRPRNEDHFLIVRFGRFLQTLATNLADGMVPRDHEDSGYGMIVADGMGGMSAGETASRMAITRLIRLALETPDWILSTDEPRVEEVVARAAGRFRDVNETIVDQAQHQPGLAGMGTTLTLAQSFGTNLLIAHVGDSPAYLLRRDELHKLTRLHTLSQAMADLGEIPAGDVARHRFRHVLTHAIGIQGAGGEPEIRRFQLADGDRLLICTDGLTDMVDDATIAAELSRRAPADVTCQALVDLALEGGGRDNVTVIVADYRVPDEA